VIARATNLSASTIGRIWRQHGLKPHLSHTFKVSNDPHFAEKLEDIVGWLKFLRLLDCAL
jgi:hypothetical protein